MSRAPAENRDILNRATNNQRYKYFSGLVKRLYSETCYIQPPTKHHFFPHSDHSKSTDHISTLTSNSVSHEHCLRWKRKLIINICVYVCKLETLLPLNPSIYMS